MNIQYSLPSLIFKVCQDNSVSPGELLSYCENMYCTTETVHDLIHRCRWPEQCPSQSDVNVRGVTELLDHSGSTRRTDAPQQTGIALNLRHHHVRSLVVHYELHRRLSHTETNTSVLGVSCTGCFIYILNSKKYALQDVWHRLLWVG